jgi:radical SAM peptide maturase (CXXX-repeat target family)/CXXX repeat peptide maturase
MDQIADYFKVEAYKMGHRWFSNYKMTFTTNGTLYRNKKVQKFVDKNKNCLFPAISIDGVEEKHDNARKYKNGKGSYKDVVESARLMLKQLPYSTMKATFGRGDIKFFKDSIIHFIELGYPLENIFANVAYEDLWDEGDDLLFEQQLKELADYLIDNDICNSDNYVGIFSESIGKPYTDEHLGKHWCNAGHGVMVGVDGSFYPCIRFLEMAFENKYTAREIGNVDQGIDFDKLRPFRVLTLENCSPKQCLECEVASGCNMCSGQALSESETGTIFNRPTYICKMHKARVRANDYFWEKLARKEKKRLNKDAYTRQLRIPGKKILNILLSADSPPICNYDVRDTGKKNRMLPVDILEEYVAAAGKENYYINFIYPNHEVHGVYKPLIDSAGFQVTKAYKDEKSISKLEDGEVFIFEVGQPVAPEFSCVNVILHVVKEKLEFLKDYVSKLFSQGVLRINLIIDDMPQWEEYDLRMYKEVLSGISEIIVEFSRKNRQKSINVLTDRLMLDKMNNCNAGVEHITLGPDGKLYLCPAFYYINQPLHQKDLKISGEMDMLLKIENAPICNHCDAYQCRRCFFFNIAHTGELNIPGEKQCIVSHIEREASRALQQQLISENLSPHPNRNLIVELDYRDPFEISKVW